MRKVGPFEVGKSPDRQGGNGLIFFATNSVGETITIKVCRARSGENFERFVREIDINRELAGDPGVLPMLESDREARPPWFAMPRAIPLVEATEALEVRARVAAVACYSRTLARLQGRKIFHRDIKPANLFNWNGAWVLGDFGIAKSASLSNLTAEGRKIGAAHYLAPEMTGLVSEGYKNNADVYSLAKTLWVIVTRQNYPLPGTHELAYRAACIDVLVPEYEKARELDRILNAATALDPRQRLSMADFAFELEGLLETDSTARPTSAVPIEDLVLRARSAAQSHISEEARLSRIRGIVQASVQSLVPHIEELCSLVDSFKDSFAILRGDGGVIISTPGVDGALMFNGIEVCLNAKFPTELRLHSGFGVVARTDSKLVLVAGHVIERGSKRTPPIWRETRELPLTSTQVGRYAAELHRGLVDHLRPALEALLHYYEEHARFQR